jgi:hypothetical protein
LRCLKRISALRIHARSSRDERARERSQEPVVMAVPPPSIEAYGDEEVVVVEGEGDDDDDDDDVGKELRGMDTVLARLVTSPRKPCSMVGTG